MTSLDHKRLKAILDYDKDSGIFRWKVADFRYRGNSGAFPGQKAGRKTGDGYWSIKIDGKCYMAHRLAWFYINQEWPSLIIDHVDGDKSNNAWENLRLATASQNAANSKRNRNNKTGFKGVRFVGGKWQARISVNLGSFDTPEEAHSAYMEAAKKLWGQFANPG